MTESEKQIRQILDERVAILDGAMGTMIQSRKLGEDEEGEVVPGHARRRGLGRDALDRGADITRVEEELHSAYMIHGATDLITCGAVLAMTLSLEEASHAVQRARRPVSQES